MEIKKEIPIDEKTRKTIESLLQVVNTSQEKIQLILNIVLNTQGAEGKYILSQDCTTLVLADSTPAPAIPEAPKE